MAAIGTRSSSSRKTRKTKIVDYRKSTCGKSDCNDTFSDFPKKKVDNKTRKSVQKVSPVKENLGKNVKAVENKKSPFRKGHSPKEKKTVLKAEKGKIVVRTSPRKKDSDLKNESPKIKAKKKTVVTASLQKEESPLQRRKKAQNESLKTKPEAKKKKIAVKASPLKKMKKLDKKEPQKSLAIASLKKKKKLDKKEPQKSLSITDKSPNKAEIKECHIKLPKFDTNLNDVEVILEKTQKITELEMKTKERNIAIRASLRKKESELKNEKKPPKEAPNMTAKKKKVVTASPQKEENEDESLKSKTKAKKKEIAVKASPLNKGIERKKLDKKETQKSTSEDCFIKLPEFDANLNNVEVIPNKTQKIPKKTRFEQFKSPSPLQLRERRFVKYAESSLEMSKTEDKQHENKKIPIYKQQIEDISAKRKADQYEFDSDSEKYKKKKRRKLNSSSSDEYNKTIDNILKNVMKKVKKRTRKVIYKDKKEQPKKTVKVAATQQNPVKKAEQKEAEKSVEKSPINREMSVSPNPEDLDDDDDDEFFFEPPKSPPKVKILSNIQLPSRRDVNLSIQSPRAFGHGEPNANSTMANNVLTPWRFNQVNVTRNPHFISLKPSSLPYINQEMVLDHTIVDKMQETGKVATPKAMATPKRMQSTIVDYFCPEASKGEDKENAEVSLFGEEMFSPIKNRNKSKKIDTVKRKILGEKTNIMDEAVTTSTPNRQKNEDFTNFGFNDTENENEEKSPVKAKEDRPFRFSVNANDKKYQRKKKKVKIVEVVYSDEESEESKSSDDEGEEEQGRLFEDFQTTQELLEKREIKAVKKKSKYENNEKPKRRKDVRTKEEEEEAEKWAAEFNSMCEEVDQFPLEIE